MSVCAGCIDDGLGGREHSDGIRDGCQGQHRTDDDEESLSGDNGFVQQVPQGTADGPH